MATPTLHDPEWPEGEAPHEIGRARSGRISIANSDSEGRVYLHAAIDAGWRAVGGAGPCWLRAGPMAAIEYAGSRCRHDSKVPAG